MHTAVGSVHTAVWSVYLSVYRVHTAVCSVHTAVFSVHSAVYSVSNMQLADTIWALQKIYEPLREGFKKKIIESLTAVKPEGGGVSGLVVIVLRFFLSCSKPICVA